MAQIPLPTPPPPQGNQPNPTTPDIFSYGFDKGMNRQLPSIQSPTAYNAIDDATNVGQFVSGGNAVFSGLTVSGFERSALPGDDLQAALNAIHTSGGGTLKLSSGTYVVKAPLTMYSSTKIEGVSSQTIIQFVGSANLSATGTNVYTGGQIQSISGGVNVTGTGTAWLANVTTSHQLFIGTRWYRIAAVISDTSIILSEAYGDNVTMPANYRATIPVIDLSFDKVQFRSSSGTALSFTDCRDVGFSKTFCVQNNVGIAMTNLSEVSIDTCAVFASTSDGCQMTNVGLGTAISFETQGNGGNGITFNNVKTFSFISCAADSNTGDGINATTVVDVVFKYECSGNGGQGIEFVSGCLNCFINDSLVRSNTSDGIKLTATSSNNTIGGAINIVSNGGYGINIANANCQNNTIIVPFYASNTSGTLNDLGTSTNSVSTTSSVPTGTVLPYAVATAPGGFLLCDGSAVSRTTFSTLFGIIGTTFGVGDGSTTFNVPDMRGRTVVGTGTGTGGGASGNGKPSGGVALTARTLGDWLGEETHILTTTEMPSHTHGITLTGAADTSNSVGALGNNTRGSASTGSAGSDGAHNNIQPVMTLAYIIKT